HFGEAKLPHRSRWGRTDSYQVSAWSSIECPEVCWSSILARWVALTHAAMETRSGPMGLSFARHVDVRRDLLGNSGHADGDYRAGGEYHFFPLRDERIREGSSSIKEVSRITLDGRSVKNHHEEADSCRLGRNNSVFWR